MLKLEDHWVWDSWYFDDGEFFHCFFLRASRALLDPQRRHRRATVGHARSRDLKNWELLPDALVPSDTPAFDELAIWTGCVIQSNRRSLYYLFYTGVRDSKQGIVQSIGCATSRDLITWHKSENNPIVEVDPKFYSTQESGDRDTDCRDPWVFYSPRDKKWKMLFTANAIEEDAKSRGVVGFAESVDLEKWEIKEAISSPSGFGQLEVMQIVQVANKWVLIFSCSNYHFDEEKKSKFKTATFCAPCDGPEGPFHFDKAEMISSDSVYAGRVLQDRSGVWVMLGFKHGEDLSDFEGWITEPMKLYFTDYGIFKAQI